MADSTPAGASDSEAKSLLVSRPCPFRHSAPSRPDGFELEVRQTVAHAQCTGLCAATLKATARKTATIFLIFAAVTAAMLFLVPVKWVVILPIAIAAACGWEWAVLSVAARRIHEQAGH
jgi:hypothetical protein